MSFIKNIPTYILAIHRYQGRNNFHKIEWSQFHVVNNTLYLYFLSNTFSVKKSLIIICRKVIKSCEQTRNVQKLPKILDTYKIHCMIYEKKV